jgi:murein DD-endopeptidase MepM/ murein hydrolase activator NlpD
VVAFAGRVAGELHVSVDHPDGVRTSYAFLSAVGVERGASVTRGMVVGAVGEGHEGSSTAHLHFGARYAGQYIDPMLLLGRGSLVGLIRLAPIEEARAVP